MSQFDSDLRQNVLVEQVRLIYRQGPALILGALICAAVIVYFQYHHFQEVTALWWLSAIALASVVRLWRIVVYHRNGEKERSALYWGRIFWAGTLLSGLIWGLWPLFFYSSMSPESLMMISTIICGMVAISAASGAVYFPSFVSFSMPMALPFAITHILSGQEFMVLIGMLMLCYLSVNFYFALRGQQQFRELIEARFFNSQLMAKLESEKQIAERAVIAKSRFLASASHDLRQPLHALRLFIGTLRHRETDKGQLQIIDDMEKSAEALTSLFNSLLDMSRLDAEIIEVNREHAPVGELFDRLRAQFAAQAQEKGIELSFDHQGLFYYCDAVLLERILRNLVVNALQYTDTGNVRVICEALDHDSLLMSVADTGCGIPENHRDEVFNEFVQLNNAERDRDKGLGLGLAIVSKMCKLMNIELSMESMTGRGTTFKLILPRGQVEHAKSNEIVPTPISIDGYKVMVIDDEVQVLQSMRYLLEEWGCETQLAESAREALKIMALSNELPSLIISDYRLRDKQRGIDAVYALREAAERNIPAVILTGDTSPERLREVKHSGLALLHKPIDLAALKALIVQFQMQHRAESEAEVDPSSAAVSV